MSAVRPWLAGLLPERPRLIASWRRDFGLRDDQPTSVLAYVGEEVAGAAQFIRPDRVDEALAPGALRSLSERDVANRLRRALAASPEIRECGGTGTFSLAGAQAKITLHQSNAGWAEPSGRQSTTHILKPAMPGFERQEIAEHMAMAAAKNLGLAVAETQRQEFEDIQVVVVKRYDRTLVDGVLTRVHQEDLAQALGYPPSKKYQNFGGPTPLQISDRVRQVCGQFADMDNRRFVQALVYNWLIVGTDAHAKNYSLVIRHDEVRLAPLYDLNSYLAYGGTPRAQMSMRIGTTYRADRVSRTDWERLATETGVDSPWLMDEIRRQAEHLAGALALVGQPFVDDGTGGGLPARFVDAVTVWNRHVLRTLKL